jgi:colicin import membrane protein
MSRKSKRARKLLRRMKKDGILPSMDLATRAGIGNEVQEEIDRRKSAEQDVQLELAKEAKIKAEKEAKIKAEKEAKIKAEKEAAIKAAADQAKAKAESKPKPRPTRAKDAAKKPRAPANKSPKQ